MAFILCLQLFYLTVSSLESSLWVKVSRYSFDSQLSPFSLLSPWLQAGSVEKPNREIRLGLRQSMDLL